jgi:hypothetical protein
MDATILAMARGLDKLETHEVVQNSQLPRSISGTGKSSKAEVVEPMVLARDFGLSDTRHFIRGNCYGRTPISMMLISVHFPMPSHSYSHTNRGSDPHT